MGKRALEKRALGKRALGKRSLEKGALEKIPFRKQPLSFLPQLRQSLILLSLYLLLSLFIFPLISPLTSLLPLPLSSPLSLPLSSHLSLPSSLTCLLPLPFSPSPAFAAGDSLCARVKIEVRQELTLERQAFDAHMRINNGLSTITLESVDIDVSFSDAEGNTVRASYDPGDTSALFFIRLDSMDNINNVTGTGSVGPSTSADIHWLIIPAPGASNGLQEGALYYVGARLTYTIGGEEHVTDVTPDYIFVKPMPMLTLDYFLPRDVFGDDAFTTEIEPPVPYNLGVRVKNDGAGTAKNLKIDSAQPKIIENELGLLINFVIEGSEVNGNQATKSLLADFGNIAPHTSGVARWIMTCTLSGQFISFEAEFSHADELGGELTSLIDAVNTHFLVRDVLVDLPGRDAIRDFLASDGGVYRVYESESVDTDVADQSSDASLQLAGESATQVRYTLSAPITSGFMYVQLPDPTNGQMVLSEVVRSDGKRIKAENAWLSKTRKEDHSWNHLINLFDVNTTNSYTIVFGNPADIPDPPVLQYIPDRTRTEGEQMSFIVEASDPDGTVPSITAAPLPPGAQYTDQGNGTGIFDWTPQVGQAGRYEITFTASDGVLEASRRAALVISSLVTDSDGDGLPDDWELEHFGSLDRTGTGDFDEDGLSDEDEYAHQMDPGRSNAPTVPVIASPANNSEVTVLQPDLAIQNSTDPDGDNIVYSFEVYSDQGMTSLVASRPDVPEITAGTSWHLPQALQDNTWYYWRVRATDGMCTSQWVYGRFFTNTVNDPPGAFQVSSPKDGSAVDSRQPVLQVTNSTDADQDVITYAFSVYADSGSGPGTLIASASGIPQGGNQAAGTTSWTIDTTMEDNTRYFWKAVATDSHGASIETQLASFFVNTANDAPQAPVISSPGAGSELTIPELDLVVNNTVDADGDALSYFFELDQVNTFDSAAKRTSGGLDEGSGTTTSWHVSGLSDNTLYYWRVKANDGTAESGWAQGSFMINTVNDSPSAPTLKNPGEGAQVQTLTPQLEVNPSMDVDLDSLTYSFEVYSQADLITLVAHGQSSTPAWTVSSALQDNTWYYWSSRAVDEHEDVSAWMNTASFFVNNNGVDDPPTISVTEPSDDLITNGTSVTSITIRWDDHDPDSNADIALYRDNDSFGEDGVLIAEGIKEDPDGGDNDAYTWDISGLEEGTSLEEGTYYVYARITDGTSPISAYARGAVTIDRTPPQVNAAPAGGTYVGSRSVTLQSNETASIYYTLDGSDPTCASLSYSTPIAITETATLKFMAVDTAGNKSNVMAETYTIEAVPEVSGFSIDVEDITIQPGVAFDVTITAVDNRDMVFSGFSGYVTLSVSSGSIHPTATDRFTDGIWRGQVQITGADGVVTMTASADSHTGTRELHMACAVPQAPLLEYPAEGAENIDTGTAFTWNTVESADHYTLRVATDYGLNNTIYTQDSITAPYFQPSPAQDFFALLAAGQTYYWGVKGVNECGEGPFSNPRSFMITGDIAPGITLVTPAGGAILDAGQPYLIQWNFTGNPGSTVQIRYNTGGRTWYDIATAVPIGDRSFSWNIPAIAASTCKIKIESEQDRTIYHISDLFTIE
ncbi:MAG: chitobiase/beta-hexosaminidase C-terminal domain-containing protein [bacterium]